MKYLAAFALLALFTSPLPAAAQDTPTPSTLPPQNALAQQLVAQAYQQAFQLGLQTGSAMDRQRDDLNDYWRAYVSGQSDKLSDYWRRYYAR